MTTQLPQAGWYPDPTGNPGQMYWDGRQWLVSTPAAPSPGPTPPNANQVRPQSNSAPRFLSNMSRQGQVILAIAGVLVVVIGAAVALGGVSKFFGGSSSSGSPDQRFVRDAAAAGILSADPNVKAAINLPAGKASTDKIANVATSICADLNNGTTRDAEAMQLYKSALDDSLTSGVHLSHANAVKLVNLAVQDVCPGK